MAFVPHGLEGGGGGALIGGNARVETPQALHVWAVALSSEDRALAHHIIDDDEAAFPRKLHGPIEIVRRARLIGVDEDEVEGPLRCELGQRVERLADPHLDLVREACAHEIFAGDLREFGVHLQRDHAPAVR